MKLLIPFFLFASVGCASPRVITKTVEKCSRPQMWKAYKFGLKNGTGAYKFKLQRCSLRMNAIEQQLIDMNAKCNGKVPLEDLPKSPTGIGGLGLGGL